MTSLVVNRAPDLTLWAGVVAERLGWVTPPIRPSRSDGLLPGQPPGSILAPSQKTAWSPRSGASAPARTER
jgi:hypothetical protein